MDERTSGTPDEATATPEELTGTPAGDDGSGSDGDGSALEGGGSDADKKALLERLDRLENTNKQLLSQKSKWERTQETPRGEPTPDAQRAESERALIEIQQDMRELQALAALPDAPETRTAKAVARTQLRTLEWQQRSHHQVLREIALGKVPETERDQVQELLDSGEVSSLERARELVTLRKAQADSDTSQRVRTDQQDAQRAKRDSAPSMARGAPAPDLRGKMTTEEYTQRVSDDRVSYVERQKLIRAKARGDLQVS